MNAHLPSDGERSTTEIATSSAPSGVASSLALPVLHEVLSALARGGSVDAVLNTLAEKATLLLDCTSAAIAILEPDRESVSFVAATGQEASELIGTQIRLADTIAGQTARTGEPFLLYRPNTKTVPAPAMPALESATVVAIFDENKPVGAFAALNKRGNLPFDGSDFLALSTLATAASIALGNARLRSREQRQSRELSVLYEAVRRVSGQLSVQEVLTAVIDQAGLHLENNGVAIFLTNDDRSHLYIAEDSDLSPEERDIALPATLGIGAELLSASQPLLLEFTDDSESEGDDFLIGGGGRSIGVRCEPILPDRKARSGLLAPIRSGDEGYGFILVVSQQPPGTFTTADANFLQALASQTAVAMENAWLYEDANRRAEEAAALYELSQAVTSTLNLGDVLQRISDFVLQLLQVDKFALFLLNDETNRLRLVVSRGLPQGLADRVQPAIGEGIPGWVMEFETPTAVQDVAADHRNASAPLHQEGVVSMTCMPLQVGAGTIGVLAAMSSQRRLFTVAEMELLYTIANQAAIAIENARMYARVRHHSAEIRKYFQRGARALGTSHDPNRVPELIASLTQEIMHADRCVLLATYPKSDGTWQRRIAASVGFRVQNFPGDGVNPLTLDSPAGWVATHLEPLAIEDLEDDSRFVGRYEYPTKGVVRSYLGVPLRSGPEPIGVLEVYTRERRQWERDDIRLLMTFAAQAAVAFQNARFAAEREQAKRISQLLERLLTMTHQSPASSPDEIIGALALGLNAPVVTLLRGESGWTVGTSSIAHDTIPLSLLTEEITNNIQNPEHPTGIARSGKVAVTVLFNPGSEATPITVSLLETAATLMEESLAG
jgi:GAF domain-containing protein